MVNKKGVDGYSQMAGLLGRLGIEKHGVHFALTSDYFPISKAKTRAGLPKEPTGSIELQSREAKYH